MPERYQQEIEEILEQAGELKEIHKRPNHPKSVWRLIWLYVVHAVASKAPSFRPSRIMTYAICLLLVALIFGRSLVGIVTPLVFAGLLIFILGYGLYFMKSPKPEKRWRGQVINYHRQSWWNRLRRNIK